MPKFRKSQHWRFTVATAATKDTLAPVQATRFNGISPTDVVVVQGTGPLGLLATAVAKVAGARCVVT
jgi:threonine dehydrogenase-like Zn-dependent dehydrogenase